MFISAYRPGSEKSEELIGFCNELNNCVGGIGRNESVVVLLALE